MPTLELKPECQQLIEEVVEILKKIGNVQHIIKYYWKAGYLAEKLLINVLGEDQDTFPVDIEAFAEKLGIEIEEENLNQFQNENVRELNRKIGQLVMRKDSYTNEKRVTIYVDRMAPPSSRRYAIANEIVHYLLHYDEEKYYENYFIMPMCPMKMEEIAVDIFSIFLLIPMRQFVTEFARYVEYRVNNQKIPITTEDWIRYLSERSVLSDYYVAYGYQYLRGIGYWIFQARNANEEQLSEIDMSIEEKNEILDWMYGYFTDECEEWLFQD